MQDVLFVLCKHKWKILFLSALGCGAAAAVFFKQIPMYQSQAKLLVRYVLERGSVDPYEAQTSPGGRPGNDIINTEIEILTSMDLALAVAEKIGVDTLCPESDGRASISDAANTILGKLEVVIGQSNNVLHVIYGNPDPELSKQVLREIVALYFEKHLEIHRSAAAFDMVAKQTEDVRQRLKLTEQKLNQLRTDSGILSLADATGALSSQRTKTQEDLMRAKADFAELQANIDALAKVSGEAAVATGDDRPNNPNASSGGGGIKDPVATAPPQLITEYRAVLELLAFLQKRDLELRIKFKAGNRLLTLNQQQIATYDAKRLALLVQYPDLAAAAVMLDKDPQNPKWNLLGEKARLAALCAKIDVYNTYLKEIGTQFGLQYTIGAQIEEVDRRKQMEEAEYRSLEVNLKNAKIDQTLDPSRMPNITVVQQPTEPVKTYDGKIKKLIMGLAGGGIAGGIGLAFLIELVFNRRVHRPIEIQTRLQLPLLLSIPYIPRKERGGSLLAHDPDPLRLGTSEADEAAAAVPQEQTRQVTPRKPDHFILPYSETIRDRILFNFEVNNVTHKPKLVAVTGLSEQAGTSTIAAGLAKAFAEIRGMKVLLVDLSAFHPEESPLFGQIPRHSLHAALHLARHTQFRDNPQKLYYASASARRDDRGLSTFSPLHLHELMPHLQASEYDYIIFDMPPVEQTSRTMTMAGMMDKVLLVLDAENTNRDGLIWGYGELIKGKADVSCVFNKNRTHTPGWLIGKN
ncbi:MAG: Wzz/FepE/Etk N-terminal domain-containing protein [Verrucomicrobiota bacterium]